VKVIGIDTGKKGAVAVIVDGNPIEVYDCPILPGKGSKTVYDVVGIAALIRRIAPDRATVEKIHSMPGEGVTSAFSQGEGYGLWRGILAGMGIPFVEMAPQTWQKIMLRDGTGDTKQRAQVILCQRFPHTRDWVFGPRGGYRDGRADAILIGLAGDA